MRRRDRRDGLNGFYLDKAVGWQLDKMEAGQVCRRAAGLLSAGVAGFAVWAGGMNLDSQAQTGRTARLRIRCRIRRGHGNCSRAEKSGRREAARIPHTVIRPHRALARISSNISSRRRAHPADFRQIGAPTGLFVLDESAADSARDRISPLFSRSGAKTRHRRLFAGQLRNIGDFRMTRNFIEAFVSGQDFHATTAAQVFN